MVKIGNDLGIVPYSLAGGIGRSGAGSLMQALELLRISEKQGETGFAEAVTFLSACWEQITGEKPGEIALFFKDNLNYAIIN